MNAVVALAAPHGFIRTEVADVVPRLHEKVLVESFRVKFRDERHQHEHLVRLQEQFGMIRRTPHRHRQL
jgi:hypothetical protein